MLRPESEVVREKSSAPKNRKEGDSNVCSPAIGEFPDHFQVLRAGMNRSICSMPLRGGFSAKS